MALDASRSGLAYPNLQASLAWGLTFMTFRSFPVSRSLSLGAFLSTSQGAALAAKVESNTIVCSAAINACAKAGQWRPVHKKLRPVA